MSLLRLALAALVLSATASRAQPSATADDGGNRMLPMTVVIPVSDEQAETLSALRCTSARDLCLRAWRVSDGQQWTLDIHDRVPAGPNLAPARRIPLPAGENPDRETHRIWPHLVREASGALLIGVERYRTEGFSGGGAGATQLMLLRLATAAAEPAEVLTVLTSYGAMIRACFSEADYNSGRPCHQELELSGTLSLMPEAAAGRPRFDFATTARVFPRGSLREGWEYRRYRRADSVWERDPSCSYRRVFTFDAATGRYVPDRPLPECSNYALQ